MVNCLRIITFLLSVFLSLSLEGSNDSLLQVIDRRSDDTLKVNALYELAMNLHRTAPISSARYARQMLDLSEKLRFSKGEARAHYVLGRIAYENNAYDEAIDQFQRSFSISERAAYLQGMMYSTYYEARCCRRLADYPNYEKRLSLLKRYARQLGDQQHLYYAYEGYGNLYRYLGDFTNSLENYRKSIEIAERRGALEDLSIALNNMSLVYSAIGNTDEGLKIDLRNYKVLQKLGDETKMVLCLSNLSSCYQDLGMSKKAEEYIAKAMKIIESNGEKNLNFKEVQAAYSQYARLSGEKGDHATALDYHTRSLRLSEHKRDIKSMAEQYGNIAEVYMNKADLMNAEKYFLKKKAITDSIGYLRGQMDSDFSLAALKEEQGNSQEAYRYLSHYLFLKDSFTKMNNAKDLAEAEVRLKVKDQQQAIEVLNQSNTIKELELERKQLISYVLIAIVCCVILITFVLYRGYRQKQQVNQRLEKEVELRTRDLTRINEELHQFIYKAYHNLTAPVASIRGLVSVAMMDYASDGKACLAKISDVAEKQDDMIKGLLKVAYLMEGNLSLERVNIRMLLDEVLQETKAEGWSMNVKTIIEVRNDLEMSTDKIVLKAIIQNLVNNGMKYRTEEREDPFVKIGAEESEKGVRFIITDNGNGIPENRLKYIFEIFSRGPGRQSGPGLGLYIVKCAIAKLGGTIRVESKIAQGSTFSFWLPG